MKNAKRRIHLKLMASQDRAPGFTAAVGLRLKAARLALGKKQSELVKLIGAAPNTYSQWEGGKRLADLLVMVNLCEKYGVTLDWVYRGNPSALPQQLHDAILDKHLELTRPKMVSRKHGTNGR